MKKNTQKPKKSSKKKTQKGKFPKHNKSKPFKKKLGDLKSKNKNKLKHEKDSKGKGTIKVVKTNKVKESKLEYKKRLNRLYSSLLLNHKDSQKSKEVINLLLKELTPNYCQASNKRNVSRILQACLKYGDSSVRASIFQKVKDSFTLSNLNIHSSKFFIKLFHYCNVDVKEFLRGSFFNEKQKNLLFTRYGSDVMDVMYIKLKTKEQLAVLKLFCLSNSFFLNQEDTRKAKEVNSITQLIDLVASCSSKESCLEKMNSVITKLVEKELLISCISHDVLYVYVHILEDKTELVSQLYKIFGQLLSSRNGNSAMVLLMEYASAKEKKFIVKSLKRDFPEAVFNQINVHLLIKVLNVTDDTKLTSEYLVEPLLEDLHRVIFDKNSSKFLMNVLDTTYATPSKTSLKDPKVRKEELQTKLVPALVEFFKNTDLKSAMEDKYANPVLLHTLRVSRDPDLVQLILDLLRDNLKDFLDNTLTLRFYQSLVKVSNRTSVELLEFKLAENLWNLVRAEVSTLLNSKSVFLLVDLLESFQKEGNVDLLEDLRSRVDPKMVAQVKKKFKDENSTGLDLLINLLEL